MPSPSFYSDLATVVVVVHALWIVWMIGGVLLRLSRRWRRVHLACAALTLLVMALRGYCPLTDLEVYLLRRAGMAGYEGGFIQHYAAAFVYGDLIRISPQGLMVLTMLIVALAIVLHWGSQLRNFQQER